MLVTTILSIAVVMVLVLSYDEQRKLNKQLDTLTESINMLSQRVQEQADALEKRVTTLETRVDEHDDLISK